MRFTPTTKDVVEAVAGDRKGSSQDPRWRRSCQTNVRGEAAWLKQGAAGLVAARKR